MRGQRDGRRSQNMAVDSHNSGDSKVPLHILLCKAIDNLCSYIHGSRVSSCLLRLIKDT